MAVLDITYVRINWASQSMSWWMQSESTAVSIGIHAPGESKQGIRHTEVALPGVQSPFDTGTLQITYCTHSI